MGSRPEPAFRIDDRRVAQRVQHFPESVIREMTRVALQHGAINLAQGFPDFDPPEAVREAAKRALDEGHNQYAITWGTKGLRDAIAEKARRYNGIECDPERNVVVTCGSTEAMMAAMLSLIDPGDEVVVFEPFYENYGPDAIMSGARARFVPVHPPDWGFDEEALKAAFTKHTKAVILNTPNNPTGHVSTRQELQVIADLCAERDAVAVTDEIYEHILFDGRRHLSLASLGDMADRTVTINALSKTYSATGWRVGWAIAPEMITAGIRRTHDFLTVGAPHPLQVAGEVALHLPDAYYADLAATYQRKRDFLCEALAELGYRHQRPEGAYYVMGDFSDLSSLSDGEYAMTLAKEGGVAVVPGSSFYSDPSDGRTQVRFMFSKKDETLAEAAQRLERFHEGRGRHGGTG
ncbi:MAG TPA: aminotransferase class I/II-fold pyridoxal phosphate-dependent enzyme [Thermoplasmata archaeon]|nr:aminotransferase class I/II-fold pyridoxal phosphate-dependent enzyme [Thermoplasmata archaeon]